jgi:hypothetical protein
LPNQSQIESIIRWLLTTGGPGAAYLVSQGMAPSQINNILTIALAVVPPAISFVWSMFRKTDKQVIAAAAAVPGVTGVAISPYATGGAADAALDQKLPTVNVPR